jgi:hypothetical protein
MLVFKAGFGSMEFVIYRDVQLHVNVINQKEEYFNIVNSENPRRF